LRRCKESEANSGQRAKQEEYNDCDPAASDIEDGSANKNHWDGNQVAKRGRVRDKSIGLLLVQRWPEFLVVHEVINCVDHIGIGRHEKEHQQWDGREIQLRDTRLTIHTHEERSFLLSREPYDEIRVFFREGKLGGARAHVRRKTLL